MGPFDHWPTPGNGMEHFFGFIGGETNQWYPALYEGTRPVEPDRTPEEGYHFMADMTDKAIDWARSQKSLMPDKPFFMYFAPGATHAPHHVPTEWADRYKGAFDQGWDAVRAETLARQKASGTVPENTDLTARSELIPAWEETDPQMRPVLAREMEVYAGFLSYADHHVGRLVDAIEELGELDNTLIYYIIGDNGASAEGTMQGSLNESMLLNQIPLETPEYMREHIADLGTPRAYNHYAIGWAHAMCAPFQWTKQAASHWGGTRNATLVHWPARITDAGGLRSQFTHVIDVAATVLEAAGLPEPVQVHGVTQEPMHGTSMVYTFDDAGAPERHETQYFELVCNRGIYHKGWSAVTMHKVPWLSAAEMGHPVLDDDTWELYDGSTDFSQAHNLAAEHPEKLRELQRLFLIQAARFNVLPLDDRSAERFNAERAGRPELVQGKSQQLYPGMVRLSENSVLNLKNKSHTVTAKITVPEGGARGVLIAQGGAFGGWSLYLHEGVLTYCYNLLGVQRFTVRAGSPLPAGTYEVAAAFTYDGGGMGKGGEVLLSADGEPVARGRVEQTQPFIFSLDETVDVGSETGTPVSDDYGARGNAFTGTLHWVRLDAGGDDHDHEADPAHRMTIAMSRQ
ncbi:arylsulfatase [Allocatelliglobosispora scoriae]|uniref:Arylsulfatase n=2 Tax=Allocatelliglobosispora scoriae TaxID=643052 RepID=A0A841BKT9_9ACTN|nr:arylsulfatase [Allocatelliglobosispora scoriae]